MRVLLANKFYYRRGGDCIYTMNVERLLRQHGHEVAVFAMHHPDNIPTTWARYFPEEVSFNGGGGKLKAALRPFGTNEVKQLFGRLLDDFKPDVVHLNNIHSQLSPVIGEMAHKRGIRVVWTLHDYKLLCPRYDCLRSGTTPCDLCYSSKRHCLSHRCMKGSLPASIIGWLEAEKWHRRRLDAMTDAFICPSRFMAGEMEKGGFAKEKLHHLCNFINTDQCHRDEYLKKGYYCYVGRLSEEKGVRTLIEAANRLPHPLIVIGGGPLEEELRQTAGSHISFAGHCGWYDVKRLVGEARFSVIPSEWYENNPLSVIEAQCLGTPVLGADIGGIPELIDEGMNGMIFTAGDDKQLAEKITLMWSKAFDYRSIAASALSRYDSQSYYELLYKVYSIKS